MERDDIIRMAREGKSVVEQVHAYVSVNNTDFTSESMSAMVRDFIVAEREACINIIETYRIPVGNSAAGEMACEWTYDALHEIRDQIRARGEVVEVA